MQEWPENIIHRVLAKLDNDLYAGDDFESAWAETAIQYIYASCRRLHAVARPLLFGTVYILNTSRAKDLRSLLDKSPRLLSSTRHLILGSLSNEKESESLGSYLGSANAGDIFKNLNAIHSLRMNGLHITSDLIATLTSCTCTVLGSLQDLRVETCCLTSLESVQILIEQSPNLENLALNFRVVEPSPTNNQTSPFIGQPTKHENPTLKLDSLPSLRALELRSMIVSDHTRWVHAMWCWLIDTGRACLLQSLHLAMADYMCVGGLNVLISQLGGCLMSLTLDCHQYQGLISLPDPVLLSRLEKLHLQNVERACFDAVSSFLLGLLSLVGRPETILDIRFFHEIASSAGAIWAAIESMTSHPHFTLNLFFTLYGGEGAMSSDEQVEEVRACIPQIIPMRGGVELNVSVSYESPDDDDRWYPTSFD